MVRPAVGVGAVTPEEAQGLDYADSTDVADTLEMLRSLRTEWAICRLVYQGGKYLKPLYHYWSAEGEDWRYFSADATWFDSQLDAEEEAERQGLEGYLLVKRLISAPEVV